MEDKNFILERNAVDFVLKYLDKYKGYTWNAIEYTNLGRYAVVRGVPCVAIVFKKEWFLKFAEICVGQKGIGDSLNCEDLKYFCYRGVKFIYVMYKDGSIYRISLFDFLNKSVKWKNKEGKEVRSLSIHNYDRINPSS